MYQPALKKTGYVMITGGFIFSIASFFEIILQLHLNLSLDYSKVSEFGPAGADIVKAFGVHIGSLVITLGILMVILSEFYDPAMKPYLVAAFGTWYVLDCLSSLLLGYQLNVIPNTIFLLGFLYVMRSLDNQHDTIQEADLE